MTKEITNEVERIKEKIKRYHLQAEQHHTTVLKTRRHYRASMSDLLKIFERTLTSLIEQHHREKEAIVSDLKKVLRFFGEPDCSNLNHFNTKYFHGEGDCPVVKEIKQIATNHNIL